MAEKELKSTSLCKDTSGIQRGQRQAGGQCQGKTGMERVGINKREMPNLLIAHRAKIRTWGRVKAKQQSDYSALESAL